MIIYYTYIIKCNDVYTDANTQALGMDDLSKNLTDKSE